MKGCKTSSPQKYPNMNDFKPEYIGQVREKGYLGPVVQP